MNVNSPLSPRATIFQQKIAEFINERKETKLKGQTGEKAVETEAKYQYHTWLADAARRVPQIQAVTHVLKASHPDAKGSSLHIDPASLPDRQEIGTHNLDDNHIKDIVGNAAALDVYKFLKTQVEDKELLHWLQQNDEDLLAAFHQDSETATQWATAFKGLVNQPEDLSSHSLAKQVYWCADQDPTQDENFHLLQLLFPSSLVHKVHAQINDSIYSQANKEARKAKRDNQPFDGTYISYVDVAVRKLGGTKPQNISQLNSERGGVNYLLSNAPPIWQEKLKPSYLNVNNIFDRFQSFANVRFLIKDLTTFLKIEPSNTLETRVKRENLEQQLGSALADFSVTIQDSQAAGWTDNPECLLPLHQKVWLDPERAETDDEFRKLREWNDWPDQVATDFALWLNDILRKAKLAVGDVEFRHWAKQAVIASDWPTTMSRKAIQQAVINE